MRRPPLLPTLLALLALGAPTGLAHRFYWNAASTTPESAYRLDLSRLSSYVVGELAAGEVAFFLIDAPPRYPVQVALLAPQTCTRFSPELWVVARELPDPQTAPFALPEGFRAQRMAAPWQPYRDYRMSARFGPGIRTALDERGYFLAIYAGDEPGWYIAFKGGIDGTGGTREGLEALNRFVVCGAAE